MPDAQSSWIFLDPSTQGNIPPSRVPNSTDHNSMMFKHNVGSVNRDGKSFANKMPEYPLVITVYGEAAKHALLLQHFQQASLCRDPLLHYMGGKFMDMNEMGNEYLSYTTRIITPIW